jgi:Ca2+-binding RTX toxin-like protein
MTVRVDLDGVADDGRSSEFDKVHTDIENILGGSANDVLMGNSGANELRGRGGRDTLTGGAGHDTLLGGIGRDTLAGIDGVQGNDILRGGDDSDACTADARDTRTSCES